MREPGEIYFSVNLRLRPDQTETLEKLVQDTFDEWIRSPAGRSYILARIEEMAKSAVHGFFGWHHTDNSVIKKLQREIVDRVAGEVLEALQIVAARRK